MKTLETKIDKPPWFIKGNQPTSTCNLLSNLYLPIDTVEYEHNTAFQNTKLIKYNIHRFDQPYFNNFNVDYVPNNATNNFINKQQIKNNRYNTQIQNLEAIQVEILEDINFFKSMLTMPHSQYAANYYNKKIAEYSQDTKKNQTLINSLQGKLNKANNNVNNITRCRKYEMKLHKEQHKMFFSWILEALYLYNFCVDRYKMQKFSLTYTKSKLLIFAEFYGSNCRPAFREKYIDLYTKYYKNYNPEVEFTIKDEFKIVSFDREKINEKTIPYDLLTDVIKSFCANVKSGLTNLKNGQITHFNIKHKKLDNFASLLVPPRFITEHNYKTGKCKGKLLGLFLGHTKTFVNNNKIMEKILEFNRKHFNNKLNVSNINSDCRLKYDKKLNKFYLCVPTFIPTKIINKKREEFCALDPGERVFQSFYAEKSCGTIGDMARTKILKIHDRIRRLMRIFNKKKNRRGKRLKHRQKILKRVRKLYKKIENIVDNLHNHAALFLCKNYERILIPKFETSKMISDHNSLIKNRNRNEAQKKMRNPFSKRNIKRREEKNLPPPIPLKKGILKGSVKFVLQMERHYKFRQHLISKAEEYGCKIDVVTEEYTSKTCGNCGHMSDNYDDRTKMCPRCKIRINRDINGSRNILIKNIGRIISEMSQL